MTPAPIFVVGVQRSGTTLLAAMLAAHSRLSCGAETHFFRWLAKTDPRRLCAPAEWARPAVEFLRSIDFPGVEPGTRRTLLDKYQTDEGQMLARLSDSEPSIANLLRSVTEQHMRAKGKVRWVEKTPDHLLHVDAIRAHFPDSPIVRIVRDPRDVALALTRVPWGVSSFSQGVFHWERLNRLSRAFFQRDSRCYTLRFEDLVSSPTEELQKLCEAIDEKFEPAMLDTSKTGSDVNSQNAPWKQKVAEAVDANRASVWLRELNPRDNQLAEAVLGNELEAFGYAREVTFTRLGALRGKVDDVVAHAGALAMLAAEGVRFWKARADERPTVKLYLGQAGSSEWLGVGRRERAINAVSVLADIGRARLGDRELYWAPDANEARWTGWLSYALRSLMARHRIADPAGRPHGSDATDPYPVAPGRSRPVG